MKRIKSNIPFVLACAVGAVMAIGLVTFAGPCVHDDGSFSVCHDAATFLLAIGISSCVLSVIGLIAGNDKAISVVLGAAVAVLGAVAAAAPGSIWQLCMMQTMRCWTTMRPFAMVCGVALCMAGIAAAVMARPKAKAR